LLQSTVANNIRCINCGGKFELVVRRGGYDCPFCGTSYRLKNDIEKDEAKMNKEKKALAVEIKFDYRGTLWEMIFGLIIVTILGVAFGTLTFTGVAPIAVGCFAGFIVVTGVYALTNQIIKDRAEYKKNLIKKITEFHKDYFKNNEWYTVKCAGCGSSIIKGYLNADVFECAHCGTRFDEKDIKPIGDTKTKKAANKSKPEPVAVKKKVQRHWPTFFFLTFILGIFIVMSIVDLAIGILDGGGKYLLPAVGSLYIGLCFMFYYGKLGGPD